MTLSHFRLLDYNDWAPFQDVVSTDHYVVDALPHPRAELSFNGDLTRGLAGGRPWLLMEHSTSAVNWQPVNPAKAPGGTILDSLAHVARGADTLGFFQWRQSRAGSEEFDSALVPHAGEGQRPVPRGQRAGARSRAGSASWSAPWSTPRWPCSGTTSRPGPWPGPACRPPRSTTRRPPTPCTGCCATWGDV